MWRTCKEAGRPWPVIVADDDFLDYMVMEAVAIRVAEEDKKAAEEAERRRKVKEAQKRLAKQFS